MSCKAISPLSVLRYADTAFLIYLISTFPILLSYNTLFAEIFSARIEISSPKTIKLFEWKFVELISTEQVPDEQLTMNLPNVTAERAVIYITQSSSESLFTREYEQFLEKHTDVLPPQLTLDPSVILSDPPRSRVSENFEKSLIP